jgi:hypothetical protein
MSDGDVRIIYDTMLLYTHLNASPERLPSLPATAREGATYNFYDENARASTLGPPTRASLIDILLTEDLSGQVLASAAGAQAWKDRGTPGGKA